MGKSRGPWQRWEKGADGKARSRGWYVQHERRRVFLGRTKAEADRQFHRLMAGDPVDSEAPTFPLVADRYVDALKLTRSRRHAADARNRLKPFVKDWQARQVAGLRWPDVERVLAGRAWNPTTQAGHLTALRGCLRWAVRTRMLSENPVPHIVLPRWESRQDALTKGQVKAMLAAGGPLAGLLWALAVTGARPGEMMAATVEQCDRDGTAIRLRESKVGRRVVWFAKRDRAALVEILGGRTTGPLFPAPKGGHWGRCRFCEEFRKLKAAAGLPAWASAYSLRHTWITERLRDGVPDGDVARLAGTSIAMIRRTYGHLIDADMKRLADRL